MTEQDASAAGQVRIPSVLNANLDQFFSALKLRILDEAVRRTSKRTTVDEVGVLQEKDLVAVAQVALTEAASELDRAFSPRESIHVRRAS